MQVAGGCLRGSANDQRLTLPEASLELRVGLKCSEERGAAHQLVDQQARQAHHGHPAVDDLGQRGPEVGQLGAGIRVVLRGVTGCRGERLPTGQPDGTSRRVQRRHTQPSKQCPAAKPSCNQVGEGTSSPHRGRPARGGRGPTAGAPARRPSRPGPARQRAQRPKWWPAGRAGSGRWPARWPRCLQSPAWPGGR